MKGVALLAFGAFIATLFPNHVEAIQCYACGYAGFGLSSSIKDCEDFSNASPDNREIFFTKNLYTGAKGPGACTRCITISNGRTVTVRDCAEKERADEVGRSIILKADYCDTDLCNNVLREKCYACGINGFGSCEEFESASAKEKESRFIMYTWKYPENDFTKTQTNKSNAQVASEKLSRRRRSIEDYPCAKCKKVTQSGKVTKRSCAQNIEKLGTTDEAEGKVEVCDSDLCNGSTGGGSTGGESTGDNDKSSESIGEFLRSWTKMTLLATAMSLLNGPLF